MTTEGFTPGLKIAVSGHSTGIREYGNLPRTQTAQWTQGSPAPVPVHSQQASQMQAVRARGNRQSSSFVLACRCALRRELIARRTVVSD